MMIELSNLTIKICNFEDLEGVFKKIDEVNKKVNSESITRSIGVSIEVDLRENQPVIR